jgi:hypothetical protein
MGPNPRGIRILKTCHTGPTGNSEWRLVGATLESPARMALTNVPHAWPSQMSRTHVPHAWPSQMSRTHGPHKCPARMALTNVPHAWPSQMSHTNHLHNIPAIALEIRWIISSSYDSLGFTIDEELETMLGYNSMAGASTTSASPVSQSSPCRSSG